MVSYKQRIGRGLRLLALVAITGALAACGSSGGGGSLEGTVWVLESYDGQSVIPGTEITAEFAGGEVSGSAGCNRYFGSYESDKDKLTFSVLGQTEMYCMDPEGAMDQESAFLRLLGGTASYQASGERLELFDAGGASVLVFVAQ